MCQDGKGREVTGTQGPRTTPRQLQSGPPPCGPPTARPTPHQVQGGAAAQVLHDDPQLRALVPEKRASARGSQQAWDPDTRPHRGDSARTPTGDGLWQPSLAPLPPRPRCRRSADRPSARSAAEPPPSKPSWEGLQAPAAGVPELSQQMHPCPGSGRSQATPEPADPRHCSRPALPRAPPQDEARPLSACTLGPGGCRFLGALSTVRLGPCSPVGTPALQTRPTWEQTQPRPPKQTRGLPGPSPCWPQGTWTAPRRGGHRRGWRRASPQPAGTFR